MSTMSHCTKFDFNYTDERIIVKAFNKLQISCATTMVHWYDSDLAKKMLSKLGYMGHEQSRAICGCKDEYQFFVCKKKDNLYELYMEKSTTITQEDEVKMDSLAETFRRAYIECAVDKVVRKLENSGMPTEVSKDNDKFVVNFGPMLEYSLSVVFDNGQLIEDVHGVKGDFCTKLTEDLEEILSSPTAELNTAWKEEYEMPLEDQNIQVLSLSF